MAKVLGVRQIQQALDQLPAGMQANVIRSGNRAVANDFVKRIKANQSLPATVRAAIIAAVGFGTKRKMGLHMVGLRKRFGPLAHLIEFGTAPRTQNKTGRYTGRMPANPFLRPTLEEYTPELIEAIWSKAAGRNFNLQLRKLAKVAGGK